MKCGKREPVAASLTLRLGTRLSGLTRHGLRVLTAFSLALSLHAHAQRPVVFDLGLMKISGAVNASVVQPDGKIIIGGSWL